MTRPSRILAGVLLFGALASTATALLANYSGSVALVPGLRETLAPPPLVPEIGDTPILELLPILRGDTLQTVLRRANLDVSVEEGLVRAVIEAIDVRKLRAGTSFVLTRTALREPRKLEYQVDNDHILSIEIPADPQGKKSFAANVQEIPSIVATTPICTTLQSSLFESIDNVGESPELAIRMADLFAWDLDFYTDPQNGDEFCLLVEKRSYENGQVPTYGRILAATYNNMGKVHDAFLFEDKDGKPIYYSSDGKSTQAAFLRSPLKFAARISSHFSHARMHPVLKIRRPHLGIDYAAPTGTPVQAVASGTVTFSGRSGGAGNLVKIRHANGFETYYMHLSRRQVKSGQKIDQGQQIGLVGATGLATGPHLDFRVRKNGRYLNFERLDVPRQSSVEPARLKDFELRRNELLAMIETHPAKSGDVLATSKMTEPAGTVKPTH